MGRGVPRWVWAVGGLCFLGVFLVGPTSPVPSPQDPFCEWQVLSGRRGDFACSRRGRQEGAVRDPQLCPPLCSQ